MRSQKNWGGTKELTMRVAVTGPSGYKYGLIRLNPTEHSFKKLKLTARSANVLSLEISIDGVASANPAIGTEFDVFGKSIAVVVQAQINWDEQYVIISLS